MTRASCVALALAAVLGVACGDDSGTGNDNQNENHGVCGNGVLDPGEQCDDGVANSDTLPGACRSNCRSAYCGDGVVDSGEQCEDGELGGETCADRGFTKGELGCDASCEYDESGCTLCGDGVAEGEPGEAGYEECDGDDLRQQECPDIGRPLGQLQCATDCTWDDTYCTGILPPDITSINGTGSASAIAARPEDQAAFTSAFNSTSAAERHLAGNRINGVDRELVIEGSNLSQIQAVTANGKDGQGTIVFEVSGGNENMLRIRFPATVTVIAAGLFALTIVTDHGIAEADVFFLQGEKGDKGDTGDTGTCTCDENAVAGVLSNDQAFIDDVATVAVEMSVPAGTVVAYTGDIPQDGVPDGWLLCDGSAVSRTTFPRLFAAIKVSHGIGDGTTTFNLPDYQGRFLRGVDDGAGRDPDASTREDGPFGGNSGDEVGSVQHDDFLAHAHTSSGPSAGNRAVNLSGTTSDNGLHTHAMQMFDPNSGTYMSLVKATSEWNVGIPAPGILGAGNHHHSWSTSFTIYANGGNETRPENVYVYYLIKY